MSTKYKQPSEVPTEILVKRLSELSDCFNDRDKFDREYTRRIPAELDRDADLVMSNSSERLIKQAEQIKNILNGDMTPEQYHKLASSPFAIEQQIKGVMRVMACKELDLSESDIDTLILMKQQLRKQLGDSDG